MLSALTGQLAKVHDNNSIDLAAGPIVFSLLIPAFDVEPLRSLVGQAMTFHTLVYLEGDPGRGNLEPRVIGFVRSDDRTFFELFTTVKGIGTRTALKALTEPIGTIAAWIESKDARSLTRLSGIGKRTAELVVAELSGKCAKFASAIEPTGPRTPAPTTRGPARAPEHEDAIRALVALGERPNDAAMLLDRVLAAQPGMKGTDNLVAAMLRARG
ncbi:MAG: helix-hairpin-helix domain-containing protein [Tepidisphaeraceae bacterium]